MNGIDALVPASEASFKKNVDLNKEFQVGGTVRGKILSMDWKENKVSISLKDSSNDPWATNVPFKEGDIVKATVESLKTFGIFVKLNDHFHALVPNKETGYPPRTALSNHFKPGDELDVFVTEVNPSKKQIAVYAQLLNGQYFLEFLITPSVGTDYWRFSTSGSGRFDMWNAEATTGFSNYVTSGLPTAAVLPEIVNYRGPHTDQSIVSSWQCLDNVITVGSYVNRDTMTNYYNVIPPILDIVGALYISSSHGPTRDNRIKPDICAPGARVLSTASSILTNWLIEEGAANYMSQDGQHYLYNGTSFSSPAVAGIAALYLQKYPNATAAEVPARQTAKYRAVLFLTSRAFCCRYKFSNKRSD